MARLGDGARESASLAARAEATGRSGTASLRWEAECAACLFRVHPAADKSHLHAVLALAAAHPALRGMAPQTAVEWLFALESSPEPAVQD